MFQSKVIILNFLPCANLHMIEKPFKKTHTRGFDIPELSEK